MKRSYPLATLWLNGYEPEANLMVDLVRRGVPTDGLRQTVARLWQTMLRVS